MTYRSHIDEKATMGIDTSVAEEKYTYAKQKLDSAGSRPSTQLLEALDEVDAAKAAISDGEKSLDKAWAENEVANAPVPIDNADAMIAWFKGNLSTANDPALAQVIAKRDSAANYLSVANDEIANGNYSGGWATAKEAWSMANESYTDALARRYYLVHACWGCGSTPLQKRVYIFAGIGLFVLLIAGIVLWKKKPKA